jgi:hypothetical protein
MDPEEIILLLGAAAIVLIYANNQQQQQSFSSFMEASGATEDDILSSIVPVSDTDFSQQSSGGSSVATIQDFASAIFGFEGGNAGDRNVRNNNPGNLKFAGQPDATQGDGGFAVFPSLDSGFAALDRQLTKTTNEMPSLTLTQFFARYLGQSDFMTPKVTSQGDPFSYANTVAAKLGVSADQTLGQIFGGG